MTLVTRYRYTGAGLSYNVGGIIGGALPPVLSPMLLSSYGSWSITAMMAGFTVVSLVSILLLSETAAADWAFLRQVPRHRG